MSVSYPSHSRTCLYAFMCCSSASVLLRPALLAAAAPPPRCRACVAEQWVMGTSV